jgi:hypothetical protein
MSFKSQTATPSGEKIKKKNYLMNFQLNMVEKR